MPVSRSGKALQETPATKRNGVEHLLPVFLRPGSFFGLQKWLEKREAPRNGIGKLSACLLAGAQAPLYHWRNKP